MIGCIQHDMIALCEPVIILYGHIPMTLAAWSLSFSSAACIILVELMIVLFVDCIPVEVNMEDVVSFSAAVGRKHRVRC